MSYMVGPKLLHVGENYEQDRVAHPGYTVPYQTYPLGQLPAPAALPTTGYFQNINIRQVMLVIVVIVIVAIVMRQLLKLTKTTAKVERNAVVSRLSTKELATRLYDRLESKGSRTNTATMRSLERLAR